MLNLFFSKKTTGIMTSFVLAAAVVLLTGCGSGGAGTTGTAASGVAATSTLAGTVATGAPVAGATVTVKDSTQGTATTSTKTASGTTASDGTFSIPVTGMQFPVMLVATKAGQQNMYSILPAMDMAVTSTQNVNITPVTTLVMYELNGGSDPASMYNSGSFSTVTAANVSAKQIFVRSKLPLNTVNPIFDMMYGKFVASVQPAGANPDPYDAALDGIGKVTGITANTMTFSLAPAYSPGSGAIPTPSLTLKLTDPVSSAVVNSIANSNPARVTATVTNANGTVVPGIIVAFTTSDPRDTFSGGANTALTNASGVATVTLTTSNTSGGASTVTASTTVSGTATTNSLNYSIGSSTIALSALTFPATTLSAYGTASVSVNVLNNGVPYNTPMTVSFTSACASALPIAKATLTQTVTTVNGTATANYLDNGCNNSSPGDTITATLMNGVTSTGYLPVSSPTVGSIQFVSVATNPATTPTMITIKGTGGINRSETARVTFRVVDSAGNPLGNARVEFSLNTKPGGLSVYPESATSDPVTGNVVTNVTSGVFSTAVRVTAKTGTISSQSDQLLITTGTPSQDGFSLSVSTHNIEGWRIDGIQTTLTARLADHFHNPVPDGTAVYFTAEGGSVVPSCITVGGVCSAVLTSQTARPGIDETGQFLPACPNGCGRVEVLVRATGEEAFVDLNSNGTADYGETIDANIASTDMGEAYVDYNENRCRDSGSEPYIDFNGNGIYDGKYCGFSPASGPGGDGLYNGLLCTAGNSVCSTQKSIDVRSWEVIIFSDSYDASPATLIANYNPAGTAAFNNAVTAFNNAAAIYDPLAFAAVPPALPAAAAVTAYQAAVTAYNNALALYNAPPIAAPRLPAGLTATGVRAPGIVLSSCSSVAGATQNTAATVIVTVVDTHGNAMPAGSVITFSASNGAVPTPASWTVPDTIGCRTGFPGCPALVGTPTFGDIAVSLVSNAVYTPAVAPAVATCTNTISSGVFSVTVRSPSGVVSSAYTMDITD